MKFDNMGLVALPSSTEDHKTSPFSPSIKRIFCTRTEPLPLTYFTTTTTDCAICQTTESTSTLKTHCGHIVHRDCLTSCMKLCCASTWEIRLHAP